MCQKTPLEIYMVRQIFVLLLIFIATIFTANCIGAENMWKITEPIITYYAGPAITDESVELMKDGGWNLIWCNEDTLDIAQKFGLKAMLRDDLLYPTTMDDPEKIAKLVELVKRVKNHPALDSYFIVDEPNTSVFPKIAKMVELLKEHDPAHFGYVNLYPTYASNEQLGTTGDSETAYRAHVDQFVKEVKPLLLSYDNYQFFVHGDGGQYFLNLALMRDIALKNKLPFMNIIQASSWSPSVRVPNKDEFRFLYYTTLAYGASAISHYVYNYPKSHDGMIVTNDGEPTHLYFAAKQYNPEFYKIAKQLMQLESIGAYHVGHQPMGTTMLPKNLGIKIESETLTEAKAHPLTGFERARGFVLGCFGKAGSKTPSHVLVVNMDYTKPVKAKLTVPTNIEVYLPSTDSWSSTNTKSLELDLLPGGGRLVRLGASK